MASMMSGCAKSRAEKAITKKDDNVSIRVEAKTYPIDKQNVIASVAGYVKKIYVRDGQKVQTNDLVFSLDKKLIELDIKSVKSDLAALKKIRAHKTQRKAGEKNIPAINLAAVELKKIATLRSKGYIHDFEENQYKKNYINAVYDNNDNNAGQDNYEKHQDLDAQIARKEIELDKLEYTLKHVDGYAPNTGYISNLAISDGEYIERNQKICSVIDIDKVRVRAGFATGLLPFIHKGQEALITFVTVPTYKVKAKIVSINPITDPLYNSMTLDIVVENNNYILQEGTNALVNISLSKEGQTAVKEYFRGNDKDRVVQISSEI